jgi:hypothetical protein
VTWYDAASTELVGTFTVVAQPVPGSDGALGLQKLTPDSVSALRDFLIQPKETSLAEDLLSDAQSAWYEGNLRRAVLELAICAEVIVKRKFFAKATAAGAAFDYFEDKSKVTVRIPELLDAVAKEAFARSYRLDAADQFQRIDYLFRCRNKVAHRGELSFRDDKGALIRVARLPKLANHSASAGTTARP